MDIHVRNVVRECTSASDQERITFPAVVGMLLQAGVERYHADLLRGEKTYYVPSGESEVVKSTHTGENPAVLFCPGDVEAAIRASQSQSIGYNEFCARIAAAGCVGYFVSLAGRRAVYYGRTGECHVEHFPPAM
jgi:uncharacterized protein YbcV (DUF1398 family)